MGHTTKILLTLGLMLPAGRKEMYWCWTFF